MVMFEWLSVDKSHSEKAVQLLRHLWLFQIPRRLCPCFSARPCSCRQSCKKPRFCKNKELLCFCKKQPDWLIRFQYELSILPVGRIFAIYRIRECAGAGRMCGEWAGRWAARPRSGRRRGYACMHLYDVYDVWYDV